MTSIRDWLESLGLAQYAPQFEANAIGFTELDELDHELLKEVGVTAVGHRITILKAIRGLDGQGAASGDEASDTGLAEAEPGSHAEYRQMTVLFCDLVGSVALGETMDAEDYRDLLNDFRAAAEAAVKSMGGYVARFQGDGLLVYFGYPKADEADAERAVLSGLLLVEAVASLNRAHREPVAVRVGVATGEAVVGDIVVTGASTELAAFGQTPNLAARLQGAAGSNELLVSDTTVRTVRRTVEIAESVELQLKGLHEPVTAHRVSGISDERGPPETQLPLIGRASELALLQDRWEKALERSGQVILITAEPGLGKSKLLTTLETHLAGKAHTLIVCQCSPYEQSTALLPVIRGLRRFFFADAANRTRTQAEQLQHWLQALSIHDASALALIGRLLEVEGTASPSMDNWSAQAHRERTLMEVARIFRRLARMRPLLLAVEDLHWSDPTTLAFLETLFEELATESALIVGTCRPEFEPAWRHLRNLTELRLNHLTRKDCIGIVNTISDALPEALQIEIAERADGVPLFVEEIARAVVQSKSAAAGEIPVTLRDALTARLDRIGSGRQLANAAAVIGRTFDLEILASVLEQPIDTIRTLLGPLEETGLVTIRTTAEGETGEFKHALIRDAAYRSMLRPERNALHLKVAESLTAEGMKTSGAVIAWHLAEGGETERAIETYIDLADSCIATAAYLEARRLCQAGLEQLSRVGDEFDKASAELALRTILALTARMVEGHADSMTEREFSNALRIAQTLPIRPEHYRRLFSIYQGLGGLHSANGDLEKAEEFGLKLLQLAHETGDEGRQCFAHGTIAFNYNIARRYELGSRHAHRSIEMYQESFENLPEAHVTNASLATRARAFQGVSDIALGHLDSGLAYARQAVEIAERDSKPIAFPFVAYWLCAALLLREEFDEALAYAERGQAVAREYGYRMYDNICGAVIEAVEVATGDPVTATSGWATHDPTLHVDKPSQSGHSFHFGVLHHGIDACIIVGRGDLAQVRLESLKSASTWDAENPCNLWFESGVALHSGRPRPEVVERLETTISQCRRFGIKLYELKAATLLAPLLAEANQRERAVELLRRAYDSVEGGLGTGPMRRASDLLATLSAG